MKLVSLAADMSGLFEEILFKRAYEYYEVRKSRAWIVQRFLDYQHQKIVPEIVVDYCLEILSHRIETNYQLPDHAPTH